MFVRLDEPVPGCIAVVPDKGLSQGHMAIYVGPDGRSKAPRVVDCSASADGIAEHVQRAFLRSDAVYCTLRQDANR